MVKGYKRRNFLIKKGFQARLILSTLFLVFGGFLLFSVLLVFLAAGSSSISHTSHDVMLSQIPFVMVKQILTAHWILIVIGGTLLMLASILLSHRIAGPLYRFEKTLISMNTGSLDETIHLRDKDEGKELATQINLFNSKLSRSMRTIQHNSAALEALIENTSTLDLPEEYKESLASLCWAMQEHNRKIKNSCSEYTPG